MNILHLSPLYPHTPTPTHTVTIISRLGPCDLPGTRLWETSDGSAFGVQPFPVHLHPLPEISRPNRPVVQAEGIVSPQLHGPRPDEISAPAIRAGGGTAEREEKYIYIYIYKNRNSTCGFGILMMMMMMMMMMMRKGIKEKMAGTKLVALVIGPFLLQAVDEVVPGGDGLGLVRSPGGKAGLTRPRVPIRITLRGG